jgi:hypothetical protein
MKRTQHFVTLKSQASKNLFPDNRASSFRTKLCETLVLQPVSTYWECAATLAMVPANFNNINEYCRTLLIKKSKRSKSDVIKTYTFPVYGFSDYTIPHMVNHLTAFDFVRHVNNSMKISDHVNFKLELSTYGVEKMKYSSSEQFDSFTDDTPVFVFRIGKNVKLVLSEDGLPFWTHYLKIPAGFIGNDIVSTFTIPILEDLNSLFIRILHPFSFRVFSKTGETVKHEIIPRIFPDDEVTEILINPGSYRNEKVLIQEIESTVNEKIVEKEQDGSQKPVFRFTLKNDNKLLIEILHNRYSFKFTDDLAFALGFKKDYWYDDIDNKALLPIDLHYNLNAIHVYSDIIESSIVSNIRAPLLALLPAKQRSQDRIVTHYFPRLFYYPVNKTSIGEIAISLSGDFGKEIPFEENVETTIKLHFRVYKE